ncbi:MAG: hypothetical protein COX57_08995 [Alphaproteobacteria bacterium CG_4_10_14_0_2_um_filter_63_37]|nr:MAG: hypothetical protein AUJ55_11420 [Proteobacteria bacterium CG1_02_64_396]PJA24339.1 MAG: hypothetical protein COX57_08995 [Alphaproteobacteria bacterium CG_4_10_14_0_2_um_filter_63_37]
MIERLFENFLWNSRFLVILAVISSLVSGALLFLLASVDTYHVAGMVLGHFLGHGEPLEELHATVIGHIISTVDTYLLATVLLIFALGLYELFISDIDQAKEEGKRGSRILNIRTLDDLKDRLAKVVLMILIVTFFKHVLHTEFKTPESLLYLAAGITLIGLALFLAHKGADHEAEKGEEH